MIVVVSHLCMMFWVGNESVVLVWPFFSPKTNNDYLILHDIEHSFSLINFNLGAFGVAIFFLISGFVISLSLEKQGGGRFLLSRFFRIYPTYIFGFSLTFFFVYLFVRNNGMDFPYSASDYIKQISLLRDWFLVPTIDGISWTLEMELKFYIVICIIHGIKKMNSARFLVAISTIMTCFNIIVKNRIDRLLNNNMLLYKIAYVFSFSFVFLIFMFIGVCLYNFYKKHWDGKKTIVAIILLYVLFILSARTAPVAYEVTVTCYSLALILFVSCLLFSESFKYNKVLNFFGDISYPLYIVHGLNGYMLLSVLDKQGVNPYLSSLITIVVSILLASIIHILIENPSNQFGKHIAGKICTFQKTSD